MLRSFAAYVGRHFIALLALFVALGGTSYAVAKLPRNSVGTKQLKKNAVISSKVKDRSLRAADFAPGELPSDFFSRAESDARYYTKGDSDSRYYGKSESDGRYYSKGESDGRYYSKGESDGRYFSKTESDGRYLGTTAKAADADLLDGIDSTSLVHGNGGIWRGGFPVGPGNENFVFFGDPSTRPGYLGELALKYSCPANLTDNGTLRLRNTSATATVDVFSDNGGTNPTYVSLPSDTPHDQGAAATGEFIVFHTRSSNGNMFTIFVSSVHRASDCLWEFTALQAR